MHFCSFANGLDLLRQEAIQVPYELTPGGHVQCLAVICRSDRHAIFEIL